MTRTIALLALAVLPTVVGAQQNPVDRLGEVLPPDVAGQVLEVVATAQTRGLPGGAVANLALEGVAKGRSSEEVLAAVGQLVSDMGRAQDALLAAGRAPGNGEIEAATAAIRMGIDGESVSELARSGPSGRSLAVPLLVMGGLAERGLPSDQALAAVRDRLAARADDAALMSDFPGMVNGLGHGLGPDAVGAGLAGGQGPASGAGVPVGPQPDRGRGPQGHGRGGGPPGP